MIFFFLYFLFFFSFFSLHFSLLSFSFRPSIGWGPLGISVALIPLPTKLTPKPADC